MEKRDLVATGVGLFGALNLAYIGYALYKNYKDYKNKEGVYTEEEPKQTQTELLDDEDLILVEEVQEPVKVSKRKVKKSFYIGVGLLCVAAIGGYSYGRRKTWEKLSDISKESERLFKELMETVRTNERTLNDRIEALCVEREKISLNALELLAPEQVDKKWISIDYNTKEVFANYSPKTNKDQDEEKVAEIVNSLWEKLHEPVIVVPAAK